MVSHSAGWLFSRLLASLAVQQLLFEVILFINSCYYFLSYWSPIEEVFFCAYGFKSFLFSVSSFKISGPNSRFFIHFEWIFIEGERWGFSFSLLQVNIQFS